MGDHRGHDDHRLHPVAVLVTHGHLDIVNRATKQFDFVVVAVGTNMSKNALFTPDERVEMLSEVCAELDGVSVVTCAQVEADAIVKGLRFVSDFDYELQMAQMNGRLSGVDTLFLPTAAQWSYVSSSLVREVALLGGDVNQFLPEGIAERTIARANERAATARES